MQVSEQDRSQLYAWFCGQIGETLAEYVMSCLAPAPFADLATKADLGRLEQRFEQFVAHKEADRRESRHQFTWLLGTMITLSGIIIAVLLSVA